MDVRSETISDIELIGVPSTAMGVPDIERPGGGARAAGLREAFDHHHVIDDDDLVLPDPDPFRLPSTSLINERALLAMTDALNCKVGEVVGAAGSVRLRRRLVDLLGIGTGLRDHVGDVGLVFIDGHEDTMFWTCPRMARRPTPRSGCCSG